MRSFQIAGYDLSDAHEITKIETAGGVIEARSEERRVGKEC